MSSTQQAIALYPNVARELFYLQGDHYAIACWRHYPSNKKSHSQTIVLCPPFGHEYTHSHRSFKHLAEYLAAQGFTVFRFDYQGTGDSTGSSFDENRVQMWIDNICVVTKHAQGNFSEVTLLGLRLGASLAALAAKKIAIFQLVLWEPIIKGKSYIRELTAIARLAGNTTSTSSEWIECAGFLVTSATQKEISAIDLTAQTIPVDSAVLLLGRDDKHYDTPLKAQLNFTQNDVAEAYVAGYLEMLDEPHFSKIPFDTLETIKQWLLRQSSESLNSNNSGTTSINSCSAISFEYDGLLVEEEPCWYQSQDYLFGIISRPKNSFDPQRPAIILLNSGSVHHIGPNRIYSDIARTLAAQGFCVLRLDLEGLGDSASVTPDFENHPYQPNAVNNAYSAMHYLRARGIANSFILGGICSGAYSAFHTALININDVSNLVKEILLINPLTFYWHEGMSLAIPQEDIQIHQDKNYYKKSLRDIYKWKKLFSGKTSLRGIFKFLLYFIHLKFVMYFHEKKDIFFENKTQLSMDFRKLLSKKISVTFIFSEAEPGIELIKKDAYRIFKQAKKKGNFKLVIIENADHTFSKLAMRKTLLGKMNHFLNHLKHEST